MLMLHSREFKRKSKQASTLLSFASYLSKGQILRALSNWMGPFDTLNGHNRAVAAIKVAENPRLAPLPWVLWTVSQDVAQKMERLFDIAYFIAKREMPFTSFPHLCHLEIKHGVDLGSTYINDKACKNFVLSIATQLKNELSCKLQKCRFVSVMADSATDVGVHEVEDVYVCHLVEGETVNTFAGLK